MAERTAEEREAALAGADVAEPWAEPVPLTATVDLPVFPTDALPAWLAEWVRAIAVALQVPEDLPAMLVLAAVATLAGGRVMAKVRPGWDEHLCLWTVTALPPGDRKSPTFAKVTAPVVEAERQWAQGAEQAVAESQARRKAADADVKAAEGRLRKAAPSEKVGLETELAAAIKAERQVVEVVPPRLLVDDLTPEALVRTLANHGGRLGVASAEGGVFGAIAGRYEKPGKAGPNLDAWLHAHDGESIRVDRIGRPSDYVRRATLSVGVAVQPEVLRGLLASPHLKGRGVLGRFLYSIPTSRMGWRATEPQPVPDATQRTYEQRMQALAATLVNIAAFDHDAGEWPEPVALNFSPGARAALVELMDRIEPRLRTGGDLRELSEWTSKLAGHTARIAALLHLAERYDSGWQSPVGEETARRAVAIGEYLIPHALAAHELMGADVGLERARWLLDWLAAEDYDTVTVPEVHARVSRSRFARSADVEEALTLLSEHGWVRPLPVPPRQGGPGRPPARPWEVNPSRRNSQNSPASGDFPANTAIPAYNPNGQSSPAGLTYVHDRAPCRVCGKPCVSMGAAGPVHPNCTDSRA